MIISQIIIVVFVIKIFLHLTAMLPGGEPERITLPDVEPERMTQKGYSKYSPLSAIPTSKPE